MTAAPGAPPAPEAASWGSAYRAQLRVELLLLLRQGENLLVILVLPVLLLVLFASARIFSTGQRPAIYFLTPGILTVAVMSTGMVTLGISTAYQRYYRVLKRLGGSPLSRSGLVAAKASAVLLVEMGQAALLLLIASLGYGWRPVGALWLGLLLLLLGAVAFAGIGITMAGRLRAELTLGGANGLYLLFLVLGGVILPISHLPGVIQPLARVLPAAALSQSLRAVLDGQSAPLGALALLSAWTLLAVIAAISLFRWE